MPPKEDITKYIGKKFGRLTIIKEEKTKNGRRMVSAECECDGNIKEYQLYKIKIGHTNSCGCYKSDKARKRGITHGLSKHKLYHTWHDMLKRCYDKDNNGYENYGGRGIVVCDEWVNDFLIFYNWCIENGWEEGLQIDRKENNDNYEPDNCRFVTCQENIFNQRFLKKNNTSGYRGISFHKLRGKYEARVCFNHKEIYRNYGFLTAKDAAIDRDLFIIKNNLPHPLNFPELNGISC